MKAKVLDSEYDWKRTEWYNVPKLLTNAPDFQVRQGHTLMHELARSGRPDEVNPHQQPWLSLVDEIRASGVWRTVKTFDDDRKSPLDIALEHGYHDLAAVFSPEIKHDVSDEVTRSLEDQLYRLMAEHCGELVSNHPNKVIKEIDADTDAHSSSKSTTSECRNYQF
jgi:hypothetical protein